MQAPRDLRTSISRVRPFVKPSAILASPDSTMHAMIVGDIAYINESVRLLRLDITDLSVSFSFNPGQSVDLHDANLGKIGRYGIISTPEAAAVAATDPLGAGRSTARPYLELAVPIASDPTEQSAETALLSVIGAKVWARVGGGCVWPPPPRGSIEPVRHAVFVGIDAGISLVVSMASHMHQTGTMPEEVHVLYTTMVRGSYGAANVLALDRLLKISNICSGRFHLYLFFGGYPSRTLMEGAEPRERFEPRMLLDDDVVNIFASKELQASTVCYICGPAQITAHFAVLVQDRVGLASYQTFSETLEEDMSLGPWDPTRTMFR